MAEVKSARPVQMARAQRRSPEQRICPREGRRLESKRTSKQHRQARILAHSRLSRHIRRRVQLRNASCQDANADETCSASSTARSSNPTKKQKVVDDAADESATTNPPSSFKLRLTNPKSTSETAAANSKQQSDKKIGSPGSPGKTTPDPDPKVVAASPKAPRAPSQKRPRGNDYRQYNADKQGFKTGGIQHDRTSGAEPITWWYIHYNEHLHEGGKIFFFSHREHLGCPFDFLSNFYPSEFQVKEIHKTHVFRSVEQLYQYVKARCIAGFGTGTSFETNPPTKSTDLPGIILNNSLSPNQIATFGRLFARHPDKQWCGVWKSMWTSGIEETLQLALEAKFRQNEDLKARLMMTGNFKLYEASNSDAACGIGLSARKAWNRDEKDFGANLLGKMLVEVREKIREEEPGWPTELNFEKNQERERLNEVKEPWIARKSQNSGTSSLASTLPVSQPSTLNLTGTRTSGTEPEDNKLPWNWNDLGRAAPVEPTASTNTANLEVTSQSQTMHKDDSNGQRSGVVDPQLLEEALAQTKLVNIEAWVYQRPYTIKKSDPTYDENERVEKVQAWFMNKLNWPQDCVSLMKMSEAFQTLCDALVWGARMCANARTTKTKVPLTERAKMRRFVATCMNHLWDNDAFGVREALKRPDDGFVWDHLPQEVTPWVRNNRHLDPLEDTTPSLTEPQAIPKSLEG